MVSLGLNLHRGKLHVKARALLYAAERLGITEHSMGDHGALTIGLKNPELYHSISAFPPICASSLYPWGT
ncbi:MAG: hypothetical protein DHS20C01_35070 [marine bacterium B5-7]|nr:MAG: hypothetical protein DHS20C01_35070 [marine bacterium B5-7]